MSTMSERMLPIGEIRDYLTSVKIDYDELNEVDQNHILSLIDLEIARSYLNDNDPPHPDFFPLRRCKPWEPEIYLAGIISADADPHDAASFRYGGEDMYLSRSLYDAVTHFIPHSVSGSQLYLVAVPVEIYIKHVRDICGDRIADILEDLSDAEKEHRRRSKQSAVAMTKYISWGISKVYYAIFDVVRSDAFGN